MIILSKDKVNGVEIKTEINGDEFKLETMMFVENGAFNTSG